MARGVGRCSCLRAVAHAAALRRCSRPGARIEIPERGALAQRRQLCRYVEQSLIVNVASLVRQWGCCREVQVYWYLMVLDVKSVRQWVSRFDAVQQAELDALSAAGPRPEWSISVALSIISSAGQQTRDASLTGLRRQDEEDARAVWLRLKART